MRVHAIVIREEGTRLPIVKVLLGIVYLQGVVQIEKC